MNLIKHTLKDLPIDLINYEEVASKTEGYSSADIVEVCNEAKDIAIKRSININKISPIRHEDIVQALSQVSSTIVKKELDRLSSFTI